MAKKIKIPERIRDNKDIVFDLMNEHNVKTISLEFSGEGDSGQIEDISCDGNPMFLNLELEGARISNGLRYTQNGPETIWEEGPCKMKRLVESICYSVLEREYGGWENNDGGYGSFLFDASDRKVHFEMNTRYTEVNTENKVF